MPRDAYTPQEVARARGLPASIEMLGGAGGSDPLTQMVQSVKQKRQVERLQAVQMAELEREQLAEEARARAEQAKAELERAKAEAETQELLGHIEETRNARREQQIGGGNDLVGMLLSRLLEEQSAARAEASGLRERMTESLSQQLAEFRADVRRQMAGTEERRPPASQLADQVGQLTELRNVLSEFLPKPSLVSANGDIDVTIRQLELQQDFQLRMEKLTMERDERNRRWEERQEQRKLEVQLRQQELLLKGERNQRLANMMDQVAPRLADALSGMGPGVGAAPAPPALAGGGPATPPPAPAPRETVPDSGGQLHCLDCHFPIPVKLGDTELTCPQCGRVYQLQHHPD